MQPEFIYDCTPRFVRLCVSRASRSSGKERDAESGNDYFGARYYASTMGRFMSPDAGPYVPNDPQTWNRYAYGRNNPLKFVDPTGMYFVVSREQTRAIQYISTLLRSQSGRALVRSIANDPRPTYLSFERISKRGTEGYTARIPSNSGRVLSGTHVGLDIINAMVDGRAGFKIQLSNFAHELEHVRDMNNAASYPQAKAAGLAGDAPLQNGSGDTLGGTAQAGANQILAELGADSDDYNEDAQADQDAEDIVGNGNEIESLSLPIDSFVDEEDIPGRHPKKNGPSGSTLGCSMDVEQQSCR